MERDPGVIKTIVIEPREGTLSLVNENEDIIKFVMTPEGIRYSYLQAGALTDRSVEKAMGQIEMETPQQEDKEKTPVSTFTGKLKGDVKPGRVDSRGNPTSWGKIAVHEEGRDTAKMLSATFHRHTAELALRFKDQDLLTIQGYLRENSDPARMDLISVFNVVDYPGKPKSQTEG
jgi:hypothetical protein